LWLEVLALRKASGLAASEPEPEPRTEAIPTAMAAAAAAPGTVATPELAAPPPPPAESTHAGPVESRAAATPEPPLSEDSEIHKKAKRFAKLLVDEIKLYNQQKVAEGRTNKDLYERLREDIDKSRATYDKRYGQTPAAEADYFRKEVIRILADNDESLLGSNFSAS